MSYQLIEIAVKHIKLGDILWDNMIRRYMKVIDIEFERGRPDSQDRYRIHLALDNNRTEVQLTPLLSEERVMLLHKIDESAFEELLKVEPYYDRQ